METIGDRLRHARLTAPSRGVAGRLDRVTQNDLAQIIGVQRQAIVRIEKGNNNTSSKNLVALAEFLKVNSVWLISGQGEMEGGSDVLAKEQGQQAASIPTSNDAQEDIISQVSIIHALTKQILENADKSRNNQRPFQSLALAASEYLSLLKEK